MENTTEVNHRFHTWGFIFLFGFMLPAMAVHGLFFDPDRGGGLLAILALLGAPLAWWLFREARVRIRVSPRGMTTRPFWGQEEELAWNEIRRVRYRPMSRTLQVEAYGRDRPVRISLMRENVQVLARFIVDEVPRQALQGEARRLFRLKD